MTVGSKGDPEFVAALRELSGSIGAEYVEGEHGLWSAVQSHGRVLARAGPWVITVGIFTRYFKHGSSTWVEVHAPYVRPGEFRFAVIPTGFLVRLFKKFGLFPFVEVGFRDFDEAFCVKTVDHKAAKSLFADEGLRRLFLARPSLTVEVYDKFMPWASALGSLRDIPDHVALLYCREGQVIPDVERLKGLFDVSLAVLERLCEVGSARREPHRCGDPGSDGHAFRPDEPFRARRRLMTPTCGHRRRKESSHLECGSPAAAGRGPGFGD